MLIRHMRIAAGAALLSTLSTAAFADSAPSITVYNQDFAVVRETVPLDLTRGTNHVTYNNITYHVEPDSVILRDPTGKRTLNILEQNYRADPVSQDLLLSLFEGKTIDFQVTRGDTTSIVQGKIIRSGYVPHTAGLISEEDNYNYYQQQQMLTQAAGQPIIEVDGKLLFDLPGTPLFPELPDDSVLKPTLDWTIQSDDAGPVDAELGYVTSGMTWKADYNVIAPETGDDVDVIGWVTIDNETGHTFENAKIKLMAGDVNKVIDRISYNTFAGGFGGGMPIDSVSPPVTEKAFDDYHLYTLNNATTLRDRETKQVEFTSASQVHTTQMYVYDGSVIDDRYENYNYSNIANVPEYGTNQNPKVWVMREIVNSQANGLGIPLPKGRMRFYRKDTDGQLEFIGEHDIDHTPKDETLRVYTGNSFDTTGARVQKSYHVDNGGRTSDESFAITLHNHKKSTETIHIIEHLYRGDNWSITQKSDPYDQKDAHTIEFVVDIPANGDKEVDYSVHYSW